MTKKSEALRKPWLQKFLEDTETPDVRNITHVALKDYGAKAYAAKLADIESYNMGLNQRLQRRKPETLSTNDIAMIMDHLFEIRDLQLASATQHRVLGIYTAGSTGIWAEESVHERPEGVYNTTEAFLQEIAARIDDDAITSERDGERVLYKLRQYVRKAQLTTAAHLYPVANGIYNQKTDTLEAFNPDYVYLTKIRSDYNPSAHNPIIQNPDGTTWDVETWLSELSASPEINQLLWQVIAAAVQPNRLMGKSVWFYSQVGNNGKGTVGQLIKNLLGPGNYSSLSVADFNHEFNKEKLIGVAANIADENDVDVYIDSIKDYKASITGDDITVNRKHQRAVTIQFKALNIQMMNGLPKTKDKSDSLYRRLLLVPFIQSFTNNGERKYIKQDYINRPEVLEYVLYKALAEPFDTFIEPAESQVLLDQYKESNNPVIDFWVQFKEEFQWSLIPNQFLYALYKSWFLDTNPSGKVISQRTFYDSLSSVIAADGDWEDHIGSDKTNIKTGSKMDADEPLITEYGLDQTTGQTPSPWANHGYNGNSAQKKRDFVRKTKYRGILRL